MKKIQQVVVALFLFGVPVAGGCYETPVSPRVQHFEKHVIQPGDTPLSVLSHYNGIEMMDIDPEIGALLMRYNPNRKFQVGEVIQVPVFEWDYE